MNLLIESARLATTIIVLLVLPGYTFTFALFPFMRGDALSRFFFSILTSICITVCTAYTLMRVRNGLQPQELFIFLEALSLLFAVAGWGHYHFAKYRLDLAGSHHLIKKAVAPDISGVFKTIFAVTIIAFSARAFSISIGPSRAEEPMTEFYFDVQHIHENGIDVQQSDDSITLPVTIRNLEGEDRIYTIVGMRGDALIYVSDPIAVHDQMIWDRDISLPLESSRQTGSLDLLLFTSDIEQPIARLDYWLSDQQSTIAQFGSN